MKSDRLRRMSRTTRHSPAGSVGVLVLALLALSAMTTSPAGAEVGGMSKSRSVEERTIASLGHPYHCKKLRYNAATQIRAHKRGCEQARTVAEALSKTDSFYDPRSEWIWGFNHHRYKCLPIKKTYYWTRYRCFEEQWGKTSLYFSFRLAMYWD